MARCLTRQRGFPMAVRWSFFPAIDLGYFLRTNLVPFLAIWLVILPITPTFYAPRGHG